MALKRHRNRMFTSDKRMIKEPKLYIKQQGGRLLCRLVVYRILLKECRFRGIIIKEILHKEIDHEETDTDIIIRADVYRMCRDKQ